VIVVFGGSGQLGRELSRAAASRAIALAARKAQNHVA
jgi:dTDP-4-dehydrorhamnose reductase